MNNLKFLTIKNIDSVRMCILEFEEISTGNIVGIKLYDFIKAHNEIIENLLKCEINKKPEDRLSISEIYELSYNQLDNAFNIFNIKDILCNNKLMYYFAKIYIDIYSIKKTIIKNNHFLFNSKELNLALQLISTNNFDKFDFEDDISKSTASKMHSIGVNIESVNLINIDSNQFNFKNLKDDYISSGYLMLKKIDLVNVSSGRELIPTYFKITKKK